MRRTVLALIALVGLGSGLAFAEELKAPSCEPRLKGVMWNFGSDEHPDVRRCDGISYVPYGMPTGAGARPEAAPVDHRACSNACILEKQTCESSCGPSFIDTDCRNRCQRAQARCETRC